LDWLTLPRRRRGSCAGNGQSLHPSGFESSTGIAMRAEIQTVVDEIKQSVGLLRRHL
jgi:hypothetical protein